MIMNFNFMSMSSSKRHVLLTDMAAAPRFDRIEIVARLAVHRVDLVDRGHLTDRHPVEGHLRARPHQQSSPIR